MVFYAAVDGATTKGSSYARSELREMNASEKAAWNLSQGGSMGATLEVDAAPNRDGIGGRLVVGQIHGQNDELVRLYWENGTVYFVNDQAGSGNSETKFALKDSTGAAPDISLNERFSYTINAKGSSLEVDVYADGKVYESTTEINSVWQSDTFYFKAGAYLGANETNGSGAGQAAFYALDVSHTRAVKTPTASSEPAPEQADPASVPTLDEPASEFPNEGTTKIGTSNEDSFTFDVKPDSTSIDIIQDFNPEDDTIRLDHTVFAELERGKLSTDNFVIGDAPQDADDYIIYNDQTGALSYDADGNGSAAAVQFGTIDNLAKLAVSHFTVI
jgi:hypothetical protein